MSIFTVELKEPCTFLTYLIVIFFNRVFYQVSCHKFLLGGLVGIWVFLGGLVKYKKHFSFINFGINKRGDNKSLTFLIKGRGGINIIQFCGRIIRAVIYFRIIVRLFWSFWSFSLLFLVGFFSIFDYFGYSCVIIGSIAGAYNCSVEDTAKFWHLAEYQGEFSSAKEYARAQYNCDRNRTPLTI